MLFLHNVFPLTHKHLLHQHLKRAQIISSDVCEKKEKKKKRAQLVEARLAIQGIAVAVLWAEQKGIWCTEV